MIDLLEARWIAALAGLVGREFGDAGINIAEMALSRQDKTALMVLKLDEAMRDALGYK